MGRAHRGQRRALPASCLEPGPHTTWGPGRHGQGKTGDSETAVPGPVQGTRAQRSQTCWVGWAPQGAGGSTERALCEGAAPGTPAGYQVRGLAGSATPRQRRPAGTTGRGGPLLPGRHEAVTPRRKPGSLTENAEASFVARTPGEGRANLGLSHPTPGSLGRVGPALASQRQLRDDGSSTLCRLPRPPGDGASFPATPLPLATPLPAARRERRTARQRLARVRHSPAKKSHLKLGGKAPRRRGDLSLSRRSLF